MYSIVYYLYLYCSSTKTVYHDMLTVDKFIFLYNYLWQLHQYISYVKCSISLVLFLHDRNHLQSLLICFLEYWYIDKASPSQDLIFEYLGRSKMRGAKVTWSCTGNWERTGKSCTGMRVILRKLHKITPTMILLRRMIWISLLTGKLILLFLLLSLCLSFISFFQSS